MWQTPLTTSTPLKLEELGVRRIELGPHGDRVFDYVKFGKDSSTGEMLQGIGVSVVSQPKDNFGWVQYRGYCPFAKIPKGGSPEDSVQSLPLGLGIEDDVPFIRMPGDKDAEKTLFSILDYEKTNETVEREFGSRWRKNAKRNGKNRPDILKNYGLSNYADTLHNKSVILIGAGPSLKKNIKHLKKTSIVKVAMLHALPFLEKEGITPEFVVHTDAMPTDKVFVTESSKDITMLANVIVAPSMLRKWKGDIAFYSSLAQTKLTSDVYNMAETDSVIQPMGCSMGAALYLFDKIFNARNFIFVGNDLALDGGETHCWDGQDVSTHKISGVNHFYAHCVKDSRGLIEDKVFVTCYQFTLYKNNLEMYTNDRVRTTNKRFINATEGGMLILNEEMKLTQAIKEFDNE